MGKIIDFFKKHPIIKTLVLMIIVFFLLIALTLYGLKLYTRHGKAVIVPEVKTMILPDALHILDREGFRYDIIDSLFIDGAVPGSVIEQTPAGGSKVKDGRIIYLLPQNDFLSKSLRYVSSPSSFHLRKCRVDRY